MLEFPSQEELDARISADRVEVLRIQQEVIDKRNDDMDAAVAASLQSHDAEVAADADFEETIRRSLEEAKTGLEKAEESIKKSREGTRLEERFRHCKDVPGDGTCLSGALRASGIAIELTNVGNRSDLDANELLASVSKEGVVFSIHVFGWDHSFDCAFRVGHEGSHHIPLILITGEDGAGHRSGHYMAAAPV